MNITEMQLALRELVRLKMSVYIVGPSGIGKTEGVHRTADGLDMDLIDIRMGERDQVDVGGLYVPDHATRTCYRYIPQEFQFTGRPKLLFFDELSSASSAVQAACYQVFNERKIGDSRMRDCDAVIGAGNRASDKGVVFRIPTPLRRRWFELYVESDAEQWCHDYAVPSGISPMMCAFVRTHPNLLYDHSAETTDQQPDPRAWTRVDKLVAEAMPGLTAGCAKASSINKQYSPEMIMHALIAGKVGPGAAVEYTAFMRLAHEVPDVQDIRKAPKTFPVPSNPSILYAVSIALARTTKLANFAGTLEYLERMPAEYHVAVAMPEIARAVPEIESHPAFTRYASKYIGLTMAR